jgi:acyl-CoA synthetase (AMP-forming)/AMP-acid ligase II
MPLPAAPFTGDYANLLELFDAVVAQCGDVEAIVDGNGPAASRSRMTFAEWERAADGVATRLAAMGVVQGDVVGISLPSSIEYAVAYQGVVRLGAVASGMNPKLGPAETEHIIAKSSPKVIITDELNVTDSSVAVLTVDELCNAYADEPFTARPTIVDTDLLAIVWTSGTTGKPKGAMFDHACLRAMTRAAGPLSAVGDRRLSPLPFAHVGYMTRVWDELMHVITTIICPTPWTAVGALQLIEEERVSVGQGVPAQWQMMLAHPDLAATDTSSLRIVSSGAARIPPEMVDAMRDRFESPVVVRYTSTEACVSTGTSLDDPDDVICNTVGTPGAGVEMELRLDDGRGRVVGATDSGETEVGTVCLRSRAMMRGYWQEPELTADAIDSNGWLLTGDLGFLDARGDLHLAGRSTEMYIRGGYNVYPIEVENHLGQHDLVDRVAVTGTAAPVLGEIGVAFVVPTDSANPPTLEQLRAWCNERLASYKAPDALVLLNELPLTAMSKIDKRALAPAAAEAEKAWER